MLLALEIIIVTFEFFKQKNGQILTHFDLIESKC